MIEIIISDLVPAELIAQLSEEAVYQVVANIADGARDEWVRLAGATLNTSRRDYLDSIQHTKHTPGVSLISLVGQPANLIENGGPEVNMRKWLLGPNVPVAPKGQKGKRLAKDGSFYRAIPFRHATPGTGGAVGRAMGDPYGNVVRDSKALGRAVYNQAKKLGPRERLQAGLRYGRGGKSMIPKLRKRHATDIYAGMQRVRGAYKETIQSQYMTFRMISTKNTSGWMYPHREGKKLAEKVQTYVAKIAPQAFQAYVASLGGGS